MLMIDNHFDCEQFVHFSSWTATWKRRLWMVSLTIPRVSASRSNSVHQSQLGLNVVEIDSLTWSLKRSSRLHDYRLWVDHYSRAYSYTRNPLCNTMLLLQHDKASKNAFPFEVESLRLPSFQNRDFVWDHCNEDAITTSISTAKG